MKRGAIELEIDKKLVIFWGKKKENYERGVKSSGFFFGQRP